MLVNRLALVTGGGSGIGLAISKLFAANRATVVIADVNNDVNNIIEELKPSNLPDLQHSIFKCDISNSRDVKKLFDDIKQKYPIQKVPTIIVNCAGIYGEIPILKTTEETYDRIMDVNMKGAFLVTQAAAKELINNFDSKKKFSKFESYASIINVSSVAGVTSMKNGFAYSGSKAALIRLTKSSALEFAKYKIRANAILPGIIDTAMTTSAANDQRKAAIERAIPLGRLGDPLEVAEMALFLASDKASYITGSEIQISGGFVC